MPGPSPGVIGREEAADERAESGGDPRRGAPRRGAPRREGRGPDAPGERARHDGERGGEYERRPDSFDARSAMVRRRADERISSTAAENGMEVVGGGS